MTNRYHPPGGIRLVRIIALSLVGVMGFSFAFLLLREGSAGLCLGPYFLMSLILCWFVGNLFPTVVITPTYLKIYSVFGFPTALSWSAIKVIREPKFPLFPNFFRTSQRVLLVKADRRIGLIYSIYGLMYDTGGQAILLAPGKHSHEILSLLREYCPHAFPKATSTE
jgi:hypothetical protein